MEALCSDPEIYAGLRDHDKQNITFPVPNACIHEQLSILQSASLKTTLFEHFQLQMLARDCFSVSLSNCVWFSTWGVL